MPGSTDAVMVIGVGARGSNDVSSTGMKKLNEFKSEQSHLFSLGMDESEVVDLHSQLLEFPAPQELKTIFEDALKADSEAKGRQFDPLDDGLIVEAPRHSPEWNKYWRTGLEAWAAGECAVVTLAGGQGTRLGSSAPKGCYSIGLPSNASLFQIQAERIKRLEALLNGSTRINWYVMTSPPTHAATVQFFEENSFFHLARSQITFFQQGVLPAFDLSGRILLSAKGKVSVAPDGNGGIYKAMEERGVLRDMQMKGIKYVHMYCVDNCLVRVGDPVFMGAAISKGADCAAKCVEKTDPQESVGLFCLQRDGHRRTVVVAEYSELDPEMAKAADPKRPGKLLFGEANIANHFFTVEFLSGLKNCSLPYHVARKKIPTIDPASGEAGHTLGVKLEAFIFDVFERAERPLLMRVAREEEFAPLKNAPGAPKDSPQYCADLLFSLHRRYLQEAGANVNSDAQVEISSLKTYAGEGLGEFKDKHVSSGFIQ